ncbi:MAG: alpha-glucan family phosphorylase [Desulfobacterales bacterium]|uniref:glycogen phosphorylase n=1 Tax=Candidatus Desulfatibia vada TaxID=2841696 RepID=A0A8J6TW72_9BACT|nr:alpha-glucan family phosphorylase [Candidatus Desulfatibia vada]MBL6972096.1 alpha-glucan family phosphorylase [Desulfobacterales bacterium]
MNPSPVIAYFSMEVGLESEMPTYSGGLGILAGDTLKAAADLNIPLIGVTLLHRKGYFRQHLDDQGNQSESPVDWYPEEFLEPQRPRIFITIEGRTVHIRVWRYLIQGTTGYDVPVYFLDTAVDGNDDWDQALTDQLYGGDDFHRLCQETILGLGGMAMLRALGYKQIKAFHMNEGHSALLTLALLEEKKQSEGLGAVTMEDIDAVRQQCVFTTHTPVPAGHDKFPVQMVRQVLGDGRADFLETFGCCVDGALNMTFLALYFSRYINGVSHRHESISQDMFSEYPINSITNGVHALTWTTPPFRRLFDRHIPEWRHDNLYLRYATCLPLDEIIAAHAEAKRELLAQVQRRTDIELDPAVMTIGFARRATPYKRTDLLFADIERLRKMAAQTGSIQVIYGGKAHPRDESGKDMIRRIFQAREALQDQVKIVYLEEYDMELGKSICAGVDVWLNTPQKPREASGTSGMKAALNGVPSLSILDGWWIEGHVEGVTGWSIDDSWKAESDPAEEISALYSKLESVLLPMFYQQPRKYAEVMRSAIALNGSFFNAQRMMFQYLKNAYADEENH